MKPVTSPALHSNPWFYFLLFSAANALLSYAPLTLGTKLEIGLFGLIVPFTMSLIFLPSPRSAPPFLYSKTFFEAPAGWVWALLGLLAFLLRFNRLTTFAVWPHYDEGLTSYYVLDLCRLWKWKLFFGSNQTPPLYLWGWGLVYKLVGPSLFSLWLFPALISLSTVPLGYLAARQFFSKSLSLIIVLLLSLGFWPIFLGRFAGIPVLLLWGECGALALLGWFLKHSTENSITRALWLGMGVGLGFYIYTSWPVVAFMVGVAVLGTFYAKKSLIEIGKIFFLFLFSCLVVITPLLWEVFSIHYGQYLKNLSALSHSIPISEQLLVSFSYLSSLFWGMNPNFHTYQPVWGGYLNPILGALFLLGVLEIAQNRRNRLYLWLVMAFIIFLLPGILTRERETFRVVPILPVLLTITALGLGRLLETAAFKKNALILSLVLLFSAGLDFHHLEKYHQLWDSLDNWKGYAKSYERFKAYGILENIRQVEGPGLVFSDFTPGLCDQTLSLADYSFNGVENPSIPMEQARWTALLTNVNYKPFLDKRFGPSRAYRLSPNPPPPDGGWMLWIVPITPASRGVFEGWIQANRALKPFIEESLGHLYGQSYEKVLGRLKEAYRAYPPDPFLTSSFWEQTADVNFKQILFQSPPAGQKDWFQEAEMFSTGTRGGYPSAHLFFRSGIFLEKAGQPDQARRAFQSALRAPVDFTDSQQYLGMLGKEEKGLTGK